MAKIDSESFNQFQSQRSQCTQLWQQIWNQKMVLKLFIWNENLEKKDQIFKGLEVTYGTYESSSWYHTNDRGLQVSVDGPGHVLPGGSLAEERHERVVAGAAVERPLALEVGLLLEAPDLRRVLGQVAVGLDPVLQAVQLPAGVAHLDAGLAEVDRHAFPLETQRRKCHPDFIH